MRRTAQCILLAARRRVPLSLTWQSSECCTTLFNHSPCAAWKSFHAVMQARLSPSFPHHKHVPFLKQYCEILCSIFTASPAGPTKASLALRMGIFSVLFCQYITTKYHPADTWNKRKIVELIGCKLVLYIVFAELQFHLKINK